MRLRRFVLSFGILCPVALGTFAARSQQKTLPPLPKTTQNAPVSVQKADKNQDGGKKTRTLNATIEDWTTNDNTGIGSGRNVVGVIEEDEVHYRADKFTYNQKTRVAEVTGNLFISDPKADVTADRALIYYAKAKRKIELYGNVHILAKPKPDKDKEAPMPAPVVVEGDRATVQQPDPDSSAGARKYPADITCDRADYFYGKDKKLANLFGNFKAVQKLPDKVRTLTADHAEWYGREDRVLLYAPVKFSDTKGIRGEPTGNVTVYTAEGNESIETKGRSTITIPVEDDEEDAPKPAPAKPKTPEKSALPDKKP